MGNLGTNFILNKTKPTVTREGISSDSLTVGTNTLYEFNVAADTAGDVGLKLITFSVNGIEGDGGTDALDVDTLKFYKGSTDYTDKVAIGSSKGGSENEVAGVDLAGGSAVSVYVLFDSEEVITGGTSQVYSLKARVSGTASGDSVATYMVADAYPYGANSHAWDVGLGVAYATGIGNFIWTDRSYGSAHSTESTSLDWVSGHLIKTLGDGLMFTRSRL